MDAFSDVLASNIYECIQHALGECIVLYLELAPRYMSKEHLEHTSVWAAMDYPSLPWPLTPGSVLKKIADPSSMWAFDFRTRGPEDEGEWSEQRKYRETLQDLIKQWTWIETEMERRGGRYPVPDESSMSELRSDLRNLVEKVEAMEGLREKALEELAVLEHQKKQKEE